MSSRVVAAEADEVALVDRLRAWVLAQLVDERDAVSETDAFGTLLCNDGFANKEEPELQARVESRRRYTREGKRLAP